MKRVVFTLFLTLVASVSAFAQLDLIMTHQNWVSDRYSSPESLSPTEILNEAVNIVGSNLQEEKAVGLLKHLSKSVPGLDEYISWKAGTEPDRLYSKSLGALKALADYGDTIAPDSFETFRARTNYLILKGNVQNCSDEWKQLVTDCSSALSKQYDRKLAALRTMMKIIECVQRTVRRNYDNPEEYAEYFELEREALVSYPSSEESDDMIKGELYYWLAELKSLMSNDFLAGLENALSSFDKDMTFILIGKNNTYPCNSLYYYDKALDILRKNLNPGHPYLIEIQRSRDSFVDNNFYPSEEHWNALKKDFDYFKLYYPLNSPEVATARILWSIIAIQNGLPNPEEIFLKSSVDDMEAILSKTNPIFHQYLFQIAAAMMMSGQGMDYWYDRMMDAFAESGFDENSDESAYFMTVLAIAMYHVNQEEGLRIMDILYEDYVENHSKSIVSRMTGKLIGDFYMGTVFDKLKGRIAYNAVFADTLFLDTLTAFQNPLYWDTVISMAESFKGEEDYIKVFFENNFESLRSVDFPAHDYIYYYLLKSYADYLGNSLYDYTKAAELYEECSTLFDSTNPNPLIHSLVQTALYRQLAGAEFEQSVPFIRKAENILADEKVCVEPITSNLLSNYYYSEGLFNEAYKWTDYSLKRYNEIYGGNNFSNEYLQLRRDLASCLEKMGRQSEADIIYGEDIDLMTSTFGLTSNPMLLDALWLEYYKTREKNTADMVTLMPKLNHISGLTQSLYQSSGNDPEILNSYMLRVSVEGLYILCINWDQFENFNPTEEQMQASGSALDQVSSLKDALEVWKEDLETSDKNHLKNYDYRNLISTLATYYMNVTKDYAKSAQLQSILLDEKITENNINDYVNYVYLALNNNDSDEAGRVMDKIEQALPTFKVVEPGHRDLVAFYKLSDFVDKKEYDKALVYAHEIFNRRKAFLDNNFKLLSTLEQENYMSTEGDPSAPILSLLQYMPEEIAGESYDAVIYRTGLQLRSQRSTLDVIRNAEDPSLRLQLDSINNLKAAINSMKMTNNAKTTEEGTERLIQISHIQHKINRMEQKLLTEVEKLRKDDFQDVHWTQIRDRLSDGEAAVEYVYSGNEVMALVITPGVESPAVVRICSCDDLLACLTSADAKNSSSRAKKLYSNGNTDLYTLLWAPMEKDFRNTKVIYITLPGILSNISFNAISTPDGRNLFDLHEFVQLTTTAQLVIDREEKTPETIAMMGDILYDEKQVPVEADAPGSRDIDDDFDFSQDEERGLKRTHFRHLPFTALELEQISGEFNMADVSTSSRLDATETKLRQMTASAPDILHLATHGYYISPDRPFSVYPFLMAKGDGNMQRSGIALAGAEKTWTGQSSLPDEEDGILTAAEVANLDLKNTGLVALSACETALGDFSFEGVYGLQRGFKQAGVQSLLVSLWSVNDRSTALFMSEFYRNLRSGESRYKSWRNAVIRVRSEYPDPYYWAPFIILDAPTPTSSLH